MGCSRSNLSSMCWRMAPCLSALPFWWWASGLVVVTQMLYCWANVLKPSELNSVPASINVSPGAPAQLNHILMMLEMVSSVSRDGAMQAAWKLVDQSTMCNTWKELPWWLVQSNPSAQMRSLKSRSSRSVLGLAIFGRVTDWRVEHLKSRAAFTMAARNPCCFNTVLNRSGLGCPKFLWARAINWRSSRGRLRKLSGWWTLSISISCGEAGTSLSGVVAAGSGG